MSRKTALVAGAGIVGSVQALLLARAGFDVTLVDANSNIALPDDSLSVRSVAMSYRSGQLLASAGLWDASLGCPIYSVLVNEKGSFGSVRFNAEEFSIAALGYVVNNHLLEQYLASLIESDAHIEVIRPATVALDRTLADSVVVKVLSNNQLASVREVQLLVAADGTHSALRAQLDIKVRSSDYEQYAIAANVSCQRHHHNVAYERFTDNGPLALLPLAERQMALVYTVPADRADEIRTMTNQQLLGEIQDRFGGRLGKFQEIGRRALLPLSLVEAETQISGCSVLIGNSARTLHPVAGQGLNLALRDAFELAGVMVGAPDVTTALGKFVKARQDDQQFVVRQTDTLARVFRRHQWPVSNPLRVARQSSLLLLDTLAPLRRGFGRRNAGIGIPVSLLTD